VFREPQAIVGRAEELRSLGEFLDGIEAGPIALVLEGELGIGKTVLWRAGLAAAADRSYRVLVCRPIESETRLAYAGLGDLLAEVPAEALGELPEPQRQALEVALLRREPEGQPSQRAVAMGTLGVLRAIAGECPTVVGIDDVQWLDPESEDVLAFVARRVPVRFPAISSGPWQKAVWPSCGSRFSRRRSWIGFWSHVSMHACRSDRSCAFTIDRAATPSSPSRSAGRCSSAASSPTPTTSRSPRACTSSFATGSCFCLEQPARRRRSRRRCCGPPWS
jgi:hypothetical protein